jgi:hypothetical protein
LLLAQSRQLRVDEKRGFIADAPRRMERRLREAGSSEARERILENNYLFLPHPDALRVACFNRPSLAADYLWLTSLQYVSSPFHRGRKGRMMEQFYRQILELDPQWVETHVNAGILLSALDPDRKRAEGFFDSAIVRNPDDYQLPLRAGLHYVIPPLDPDLQSEYSERAAFYLEMALRRKTLPPDSGTEIRHLLALLLSEAGQQQAAAAELRRIAEDPAVPDQVRNFASGQWVQVLSLLREGELRKLASQFRARENRWPAALKELFPERREPADGYGLPFRYDPASGRIDSEGLLIQRANQWASIVEVQANLFHAKRGRFPADLKELGVFLREHYTASNRPFFPVVESLGKKLDRLESPFGGPDGYDSQSGKVQLPPEASPERLRANLKMAREGREPPAFQD